MQPKVPIIITHEGAPRKSNNKLLEPGSNIFITGRARKENPFIFPGDKMCSNCGETKPISEFYKNRSVFDGLAYWCKECHNSHYVGTKPIKK